MSSQLVPPTYRNIASCEKPEHDHHWPTSGHIEIERCEHFCLFCTGEKALKRWSSAWFLRRHVRDYHVKHEYSTLVVSEGWQARPTGNIRPVNKKQRAPGSNKKRAGTKREHRHRMRNLQTALLNSFVDNGSSASSFSSFNQNSLPSYATSTASTYPTSLDSSPYSNSELNEYGNSAASSPYPFQFSQNDNDILKHVGAFVQQDNNTNIAPEAIMNTTLCVQPSDLMLIDSEFEPTTLSSQQSSAESFDQACFDRIHAAENAVDPALLLDTFGQQQSIDFNFKSNDNSMFDAFINVDNTETTATEVAEPVNDLEPFPDFSQEIADSIFAEDFLTIGTDMYEDHSSVYSRQLDLDDTFNSIYDSNSLDLAVGSFRY